MDLRQRILDAYLTREESWGEPMRLYTRWAQWADYAAQGYGEGLSGEELIAAGAAMSEVRQVAPTLEALGALRQRVLTQPSSGRPKL
ncbi:hypothetical protein D7V97_08040 [Corallococcus sp. CA053C]|nr:hypothetical protein D7V97_08040 [Corallococcus sp. CA053C]